jgi:osmoprotectant transport system substrate-binding protein
MGRLVRFSIACCAAVLGLVATNAASACTHQAQPVDHSSAAAAHPVIRVASFDFVESQVIAEIYAQDLEGHGYPVRRVLGLGSREVVEPSLDRGLIDVVPEYAGSAYRFLTESQSTANPRPADLTAVLLRHGLLAAQFSPAEDQNGVVVTTATAHRYRLARISDLMGLAARFRFGGPPECPSRPFCLQGLQQRYGLRFRGFEPMSSRLVTVQALNSGEIDVGMLETTDPNLAGGGLVLLADDRRLQPAENVVPVVRRALVQAYGAGLLDVLNGVSAKLTTADLVQLNRQLEIDRAPLVEVARKWLATHGVP